MANSPRFLVTGNYTTESLTRLQVELNAQVQVSRGKYPTDNELKGVSGLLVRSQTAVDKKLLDRTLDLKAVVTATSGFDHIDLEECQKRNIVVMHTPDANAPCAAEITLLLLLSLSHKMSEAQSLLKNHNWKSDLSRTSELRGQNLGLIGLGRVGSRVAKLAQGFGMSVSAFDPYIEESVFTELGVERLGLTELFIQCPILSFHVPLTRETYRLVNRATLDTMTPGVAIVNASRGSVIDETELVEAMERGIVSAAALDVFEQEPLPQSSRLRKMKNVFLTPHIGGFSREAFERGSSEAVDKMIGFFKEEKISDALPPLSLWYHPRATRSSQKHQPFLGL